MQPRVKTRILIISDTHGMLDVTLPQQPVDVAIHCGDLTEESKLQEFDAALQLLRAIDAPLKLAIAGNHDFTLDEAIFRQKANEARAHSDQEEITKVFGDYGQARSLLTGAAAKEQGIHFLDQGTHRFTLANGAVLNVYASPFTPSLGDWGFQYHPDKGHDFEIAEGTDVAITHGPPRGILDRTDSRERAGCPRLFAAVARSKPRIHCFGHIHEGWGAKLVAWRGGPGPGLINEEPSHLTSIDNDKSRVIEMLSTLQRQKFDDEETARDKNVKVSVYAAQRFCGTKICRDANVPQTLFVNAAIQARDEGPPQLPWLVEVDLTSAEADSGDFPPKQEVEEGKELTWGAKKRARSPIEEEHEPRKQPSR